MREIETRSGDEAVRVRVRVRVCDKAGGVGARGGTKWQISL